MVLLSAAGEQEDETTVLRDSSLATLNSRSLRLLFIVPQSTHRQHLGDTIAFFSDFT